MSQFLRHIRSICLLPVMVTIIIPTIILWFTPAFLFWKWNVLLTLSCFIIGLAAIIAGLILMYNTIRLFASVGKGTLAPWDPTEKLVVNGVYRHVRNPMISGVISILFGEVILFGSPGIASWFLIFSVGNFIYMPLSEEPGLEKRFGEAFRLYKQNVPRWIPQIKPWEKEN